MTRVSETAPGSKEVPLYKSHPSRLNISLRNAYNNLRGKVAEKSKQINKLRENKRDLENSRESWREKARAKERELEERERELELAQKRIEELESKKKTQPLCNRFHSDSKV